MKKASLKLSVLKSQLILLILGPLLLAMSCSKEEDPGKEKVEEEVELPDKEEPVEEGLDIYIPDAFREMDLEDNASTWSYQRSRQSEHFIVFWGAGYGEMDPDSSAVPEAYRVDLDNLLSKAEHFYTLNVEELGFAETGSGNSNLDRYKMMIFLFYQEEWLATGSGYDDTIGALWISPGTSQPVGTTLAHEIGHSFQYQVYSDLRNGHGFRYGFGGNGGNGFWEQTANWQAFYAYPEQTFENANFDVYINNYFRHIHHEHYRYASYFIHYYWTDKHGQDFIGRLWREAQEPEDPIEAYMRITGIDVEQLNDEIYDAATRLVTWDLDAIRSYGKDHIGAHRFAYETRPDGSHQVAYDFAPGTTGYNVIRLKVPQAGEKISTTFNGMANATGYNQVTASRAGWRYGYVAWLESGERVYGQMHKGPESTVSFTVPEHTEKLWFVVTGAPNTYEPHAWDEDNSNDDQWPYAVKFNNTNIYDYVDIPAHGTPGDVTMSYDLAFPVSATAYTGETITIETVPLSEAFLLQPGEIQEKMEGSISFFAVEKDGTLNSTTTANGYGHWFDDNGNVVAWGDRAAVFSEFNIDSFAFTIGQFPDHNKAGDVFTIKQALVYEYEPGKTAQATFVFHITLE